MSKLYRKKSTIIRATEFTSFKDHPAVYLFRAPNAIEDGYIIFGDDFHGDQQVSIGDFIVDEPDGEGDTWPTVYKKEEFLAEYELVEDNQKRMAEKISELKKIISYVLFSVHINPTSDRKVACFLDRDLAQMQAAIEE